MPNVMVHASVSRFGPVGNKGAIIVRMDILIHFLKPLNSMKANFGEKLCHSVSGGHESLPVTGIDCLDPCVEMKPTKFPIFPWSASSS
jgi:hypothetical protein